MIKILSSVRSEIRGLKDYAAGKKPKASSSGRRIKLASNENPFGSSKLAMQAIRKAAEEDLNIYPDSKMKELRKALVEFWGARKVALSENQFLFGDGSGEILNMLIAAFCGEGDTVVIPEKSFSLYSLLSIPKGAEVNEVPRAEGYVTDLDAMLDYAQKNSAKMILFANPDNPTSTFIRLEEIRDFMKKVPEDTAVVLDEAYIHFIGLENSALFILEEFPNLIIMHTFSKAYGLAALRVGYGVMHPEIEKMMEKIRLPFNLGIYQQVGATAALQDDEFLEMTVSENRKGLDFLTLKFDEMGLSFPYPFGNFVMVDLGEDFARVYAGLEEAGISVRNLQSFGYGARFARITSGTSEENEYLTETLEKIYRR